MHKLSRREALRGTGVAALAAGVAVVPFAAANASVSDAAASSELAQLIEAHRAAYHAFCEAIDREQERSGAYADAREEMIIPCLLGGGVSLNQGREQVRGSYRYGVFSST